VGKVVLVICTNPWAASWRVKGILVIEAISTSTSTTTTAAERT
jgi:hypothetical protein